MNGEKIKSRWKRCYLEGDIIGNDGAKDENCDTGDGSNGGKATGNRPSSQNNSTTNHTSSSATATTLNNNTNSNHANNTDHLHHHHHHHHPHLHNNINSNNTLSDLDPASEHNKSDHRYHNHHHHHHSKHHSNGTSGSKHSSTPPAYEPIIENLYLDKRKSDHHRNRKDARSMICDCILTKEERARGVMGCLDDCLNRMLMIECGPKCSLGDHCLNKRFQKCQSAKVEVFKTRKKGWGLRTTTELPANSFIMEYVGEVVRSKELRSRIKKYTKAKIKHHYFMALRSDEIIDATCKGNLTRFINHSCEPNCETQKWTVNGDLRIGFFTIKDLQAGDEITFDYQFQRYGRKAQKCYCETPSCRGHIGGAEQTFSLNGHSSSRQHSEDKALKKAYKHGLLVDVSIEDKIKALAQDAVDGLKTREQVLALATLSLKTEELNDRRNLLDIIKATKSEISLRLFVDYHGLEIICLWMRDPQADCDFKASIIEILERLPITNKTKVVDSHVYRWVERWATEEQKSTVHTITEPHSTENSYGADERSRSNSDAHEDGDDDAESRSSRRVSILDENNDSQQINPPQTPTKKTSKHDNSLPQPQTNPRSPNIKALASRLLKKFQALTPGFKIPRLNRQQRQEMEKKLKEELANDELALEKEKEKPLIDAIISSNPMAPRPYVKTSTTNGLVGTTVSDSTSAPIKRKFDQASANNNIDLTPAPKLSKEEHRQQFEMNVRLKDYYDTVERHYGSAIAEQLKMNQLAYSSSLNGFPMHYPHPLLASQNLFYLSAAAAAAASHPLPIISPSLVVSQQPMPSQQPVQASLHLSTAPTTPVQQPPVSLQPRSPALPSPSTPVVQPSNVPKAASSNQTLIVLANNYIEPTDKIDDALAFSICDYDEYYTLRDRPLEAQDIINNEAYPYPGSYYTTPDGEKYFVTVTHDRGTQQPKTVILNLNKIGKESREASEYVAIKEEKHKGGKNLRLSNGFGSNIRRSRHSLSNESDISGTHKSEVATKEQDYRQISSHRQSRIESSYPFKPGARPASSRVTTLHEIQQ